MSVIVKEIIHLAKHSAVYGVANMLGKAIGFLLIPLYTHYIPPVDYGTLELLDLSINIIGMFVGLGLANSVARFYYDTDKTEEKKQVVSSALILLILITLLMLLLFLPLSRQLASLLFDNAQLAYYIQISLFTFALNAVLEIPLTLIRAREQSLFFSIIALSRLTLSLALNIYFIVFLHLGILGILYSGLITSALFSLGLVLWCLKDCGFYFRRALAWKMVLFGAPLILNSLGMFVINFGDRFILKESSGLAEVGIYSLGYKIGMGLIAFLVGQPFFLIWSVRRYSLIKEEGGSDRYGQIFILYSLLLFWIWLFITGFSREMITLLAPDSYYTAWEILPIIALGYILREWSDFFRGAFMIKNKTSYIGIITLVVSLYCIISYLILIPRYQAMGAAVATLSTFLLMALINGYWSIKVMPEIDYRLKRLGLLSIWFASLAILLVLCNQLPIPLLPLLLCKVTIIGLGLFFSLILAFTKEERHNIVLLAKTFLSKNNKNPSIN